MNERQQWVEMMECVAAAAASNYKMKLNFKIKL